MGTDPAEQFWNSYSYCGSNPTNFIDPDGAMVPPWLIGMAIGATVGAVAGGIYGYNNDHENWGWYAFGGAIIGGGIGAAIGYGLTPDKSTAQLSCQDYRDLKSTPWTTGDNFEFCPECAMQDQLGKVTKVPPVTVATTATATPMEALVAANQTANAADLATRMAAAIFNGSEFSFQGQVYRAVSGGFGRGPLPQGEYTATNLQNRPWGPNDRAGQSMIDPSGLGWSVNLDANFNSGRFDLRIHPDRAPYGTEGCIGIQGNTNQLYNQLRNYFRTGQNFRVWVQYDFMAIY